MTDNFYTFRFDDICINADMDQANAFKDLILSYYPDSKIIYAISPLVHNMDIYDESEKQRIFPKLYNALSDYKAFFKVTKLGIPEIPKDVVKAAHGLVHVDHRLLTKESQELSILISTSLTDSRLFVPPFNKYNSDTEEICANSNIDLIRFEDGWRCIEYEKRSKPFTKYYLHHRELTTETLESWLK